MGLIHNHLLGALPAPVLAQISTWSDIVPLSAGQVLQQSNARIEQAHFPMDGVLSVMAKSCVGDGEIGMIGREGTTALPLLLGSDRSPQSIRVQIAGRALQIEADRLRRLIDDHDEVRSVLLRYAHCWTTQLAQTSLANARNTVRERLSRWLLMCQDRTDSGEIAITHEALAATLGVRRPGVTVATHELEGQGGIRAKRGCIRILDRDKLIADARSSYGVAEAEYERLVVRRVRERVTAHGGDGVAAFSGAA